MPAEYCLILHRKSANDPAVKAAVKSVRANGIKLRVRIPWNKDDKPRVVREALADGAKRIIVGGGDGTLNAVTHALVGNGKKKPKVVIGLLPLGTANDFAHGCGLPVADPERCLEIACTAPSRRIDVGRANERSFLNVTSGGVGAEITATAAVTTQPSPGGDAPTIMELLEAFDLRPHTGRLFVPGEDPVEGSLLVMTVGNNRLTGGGFVVAPQARLNDGLLDLAIVTTDSGLRLRRREALSTPIESAGNRYLHYAQLPRFTIETERDMHFNLDGEPLLARRIRFSVLKKHLRLVCEPGVDSTRASDAPSET